MSKKNKTAKAVRHHNLSVATATTAIATTIEPLAMLPSVAPALLAELIPDSTNTTEPVLAPESMQGVSPESETSDATNPGTEDEQHETQSDDLSSGSSVADAARSLISLAAEQSGIAVDEVARSMEAEQAAVDCAPSSYYAIWMELPLDQIDPNPYNRKESVETNLQELADSIARHGVQSEIKVRPKDGGRYEIVYGERRYRASLLAGRTTIPAKIESMTDEQAEVAAIIENMQRENYTPFEEGEIFCRQMERGLTVEGLCLLFGKSEAYVRTRINLTRLIPEVAQMLRSKAISLEIAKEFANYNKKIQKEVYEDHFKEIGGYNSWAGLPAKEVARRLHKRYLTRLDNYYFDKTDCMTCAHNTLNQVLFSLCGDCAGCKRPSCLQKKNVAYLTDRCVDLVTRDPHVHLAATGNSEVKVIERLTEQGHEVERLDRPTWNFQKGPQKPTPPQPEEYADADDLAIAQEEYQKEMEQYEAVCAEWERQVSEGRKIRYAIIGDTEVAIRYEQVRIQTGAEDGSMQTVEPAEPAMKLLQKDRRNREICYEHIISDLQKLLLNTNEPFPTGNIKARERQLFSYVVLDSLRSEHQRLLGLSDFANDTERLKLAETLTSEQRTMLMRMAIFRYCVDLNAAYCEPDSVDAKIIQEFATMHYREQAQPIVERYEQIYDKRHHNLSIRIDKIREQAEIERVQAQFEKGVLFLMTDGTVLNIATGEVLDEQIVEIALGEKTIPELPLEEPLPCDEPEPVIPTVEPDPEPWQEPLDPMEFIPMDAEPWQRPAPARGGKTKTKGRGKRLALGSMPEKAAA